MRKRSERTVTESALRTLCYLPDTFAYETDTKATGYEDKRTGKTKYIPTMSRGKADIAIVRHGLAGALEMKLDGGKLKPHQKEWAESYKRGHGFVGVAYSVGEAVEFWKGMNPALAPVVQEIVRAMVNEWAKEMGALPETAEKKYYEELAKIHARYSRDDWRLGI